MLFLAIAVGCRSQRSIISQYETYFKSDILSLELLDSETDGKCIDGTPAGYYLRIVVIPKNQTSTKQITSEKGESQLSNNWILYLEGGGWCYSDVDCYLRSFEDLGSSKNYHRFLPDRFGGLLSKDNSLNYPFSTYNLVYVKYCDGNSFAGDRENPIFVNNKPLYFRGKKVKERVLESLLKKTHFYDAENIIVTGCSAGGLSSLLQADSIAQWVHHNLRKGHNVDVAAIPISGFFVDLPNIYGQHVYRDQMIEAFLLTNATSGLNPNCVNVRKHMKTSKMEHNSFYSMMYRDMSLERKRESLESDAWRCNMAEYSFCHSVTRTFILNSAIDSYQRDCILSAMPVHTDNLNRVLRITKGKGGKLQRTCDLLNKYQNINGNCSAAEGFQHCGIDLTDCPLTSFTPLVKFQREFLNRTLSSFECVSKYKSSVDMSSIKSDAEHPSLKDHGAFLSSCITHCEGKRDSSWNAIKINNVSIRHAVLEWYFNTSKNQQSLNKFCSYENGDVFLKDKFRTKLLPKKNHRVYIDCALKAHDYDECNPTCIQ